MEKKLTYAFASSPHSCKYNKGRGCWLVWSTNVFSPIIFQPSEKFTALEYFESIDLPVNTYESFTRDHITFRNTQGE